MDTRRAPLRDALPLGILIFPFKGGRIFMAVTNVIIGTVRLRAYNTEQVIQSTWPVMKWRADLSKERHTPNPRCLTAR